MGFALRLKPALSAHEQYVASWLFLAMLVIPRLVMLWPTLTGQLRVGWVLVAAEVCVIVLTALLVGEVMRRKPKFHASVTPLAFAHAFVTVAAAWVAGGIWVLVTGRPFARYAHYHVPRADSYVYFGVGGSVALLAVLCGWAAERHRRRR